MQEEICELANKICDLLDVITDNNFVDYITNCINDNSHASIENFNDYMEDR